jgi:transposase
LVCFDGRHFILCDDKQWAMIVPHLPSSQRGPERHDDRRNIIGIMYVLKIACRRQDSERIWPLQDRLKPICALE